MLFIQEIIPLNKTPFSRCFVINVSINWYIIISCLQIYYFLLALLFAKILEIVNKDDRRRTVDLKVQSADALHRRK